MTDVPEVSEPKKKGRLRWWLAAAFAVFVVWAYATEDDEAAERIHPGRRDVISSETSCHLLQIDFDAAYDGAMNGRTSEFRRTERAVMELADDRMREIGCYG